MNAIYKILYRFLVKTKSVSHLVESDKRAEAIGYSNWVGQLNKTGFPRNENKTMMDCWQLYDYFHKSESRNTYINHASKK